MVDNALATPLLQFEPKPDPDPLLVSPGSDAQQGALTITVGRGPTAAYCRSVTVKIPVGTEAGQLIRSVEAVEGVRSSLIGGTDPDEGDGWSATKAIFNGGNCIVTFEPYEEPVFDGDWTVGLVLTHMEINNTVGTVPIEIIERTSPTQGNYTETTTTIEIAKLPADFVLRDFRPDELSVRNGGSTILRWVTVPSPEVRYTMSWSDGSNDVSLDRSWPTPALTETSGFTLRATVPSPTGDVTHAVVTTVMVGNPSLKFRDLAIGQRLTIGAAPAVTMTSADVTFDIPVHMTATPVTVAAMRLEQTATLTVGGTLCLPSTSQITGTLELATAARFASSATVDLTNATVLKLAGAPTTPQRQSFTAETDGFLLLTNDGEPDEVYLIVNDGPRITVRDKCTTSHPIRVGDRIDLSSYGRVTWIPFGAQ